MAVKASDIMTLVGRILNDEDATRWTFAELCGWINEAVSAIVLAKPSASSQTVVLTLIAGTWQQLGSAYMKLLRLVRNITTEGPPRVGGRMIRITDRAALDAQEPNWHNPSKSVGVEQTAEVRQYTYDEDDPRSYYVYPGNDGTGKVEAVVSVLPTVIVATGDPTLLSSYDVAIGLDDVYETPILDYVLWRAMSKDDTAGNPAGALAHYQAFATALGIKRQIDTAKNPKAGVAS